MPGMLLFIILYPIIMFLFGDLSLGAFGLKKTIPGSFICGFITSFALFQLTAFPMHMMRCSFWTLFAVYGSMLAVLTAVSAFLMIKNGAAGEYLRSFRDFFRRLSENRAFTVIFAVVVLMQFAFALLIRHDNSDDGFYMSRSLETLESGVLNMENGMYAAGYAYNSFRLTSDASTFEYYRSFFSALFGVHVSILSHTAMQIVYSVFAYFAAYLLIKRLVGNDMRKILTFLFFFAALMLFANLGGNTEPFYFVRYEWHGKALVATVVAPVLMSLCCDIIDADIRGEKIRPGIWVYCSACLIAGIGLSTIGIMLPPVIYVACGLPYMLHGLSRLKRLALPAILSLIPVFAFGALQYINRLNDSASLTEASETVSGTGLAMLSLTERDITYWTSVFRWQMLSTGIIIPVLFVTGIVYTMIRTKGAVRYILCGSTFFIFLTFLNPALSEEVSTYLTTPYAYYRLYWVLPSFYIIAYALNDVFSPVISWAFKMLRSTDKHRSVPAKAALALAAALCFGAVCYAVNSFGSDDYMEELAIRTVGSESSSNLYRIPQATIDLCDYMLENSIDGEEPKIVCFGEYEPYLRQYTSGIVLVTDNRHIRGRKNPFPGTDVDVCDFVYGFYRGEIDDGALVDEMFKGFGVDYVLIPDGFELPDGCSLKKLFEINGYGELDGYSLYAY